MNMRPDLSLTSPARFSIVVTNLKNKRVKTWYLGGNSSIVDHEAVGHLIVAVGNAIMRMVSASGNGNKDHRKRVAKSKG